MTSNITVSVNYTLEYTEEYYNGGSIYVSLGDSKSPYMKWFWINPDFVKSHKVTQIDYDEEGFCTHLPGLDLGIVQNYDLIKQECRKLILKSIL